MFEEVGFVYVLTNKAMPGLVKIGMTQNSPAQRARELVSTGVPAAFFVEYCCVVYNPRTVERSVHESLIQNRVEREWFSIDVQSAVEAIRQSGHRLLDEFIPSDSENNALAQENIVVADEKSASLNGWMAKILGKEKVESLPSTANNDISALGFISGGKPSRKQAPPSIAEQVATSAARSAASSIGRQIGAAIVRGLLGSLLGKRR